MAFKPTLQLAAYSNKRHPETGRPILIERTAELGLGMLSASKTIRVICSFAVRWIGKGGFHHDIFTPEGHCEAIGQISRLWDLDGVVKLEAGTRYHGGAEGADL